MPRLDDVCAITMGQSPDSSTYNKECNGLPFFQGNADFGESHPSVRMWCSEPSKIARENDILISVRAPIGALNIANCECCIGRGLAALTVNNDICTREYLWYALSSKIDELNSKGTGSTFKAVNKSTLSETEIPLPPLDEQRHIAATLDKVTDLISKRRQQLDKLDELIKSRFVEMFGDPGGNPAKWKMERAEKHIDLLSGFPFDSTQYTQSGVNICGGLIIMPQRINWNDCKHWGSIVGYEEYSLQENDIVIALDRPWISDGFKIAMVDKEHLPALLIQRTARIRAVDVNQRYLMYCFMLGSFDAHCNITGSLVPHISPKDIKSFLIMIPPIELQNQFATFVEESEKTQTAISRSLEKLETLKKALMQEYFGDSKNG